MGLVSGIFLPVERRVSGARLGALARVGFVFSGKGRLTAGEHARLLAGQSFRREDLRELGRRLPHPSEWEHPPERTEPPELSAEDAAWLGVAVSDETVPYPDADDDGPEGAP